MRVELDRHDLLPQYQGVETQKAEFKHFSPLAQKIIIAVGRATFYSQSGNPRDLNIIYPPECPSYSTLKPERSS